MISSLFIQSSISSKKNKREIILHCILVFHTANICDNIYPDKLWIIASIQTLTSSREVLSEGELLQSLSWYVCLELSGL